MAHLLRANFDPFKTLTDLRSYLPLFEQPYHLDRLNKSGALAQPVVWLWLVALIYGGLSLGLFLWAMAGRPLLRLA